MDAMVAMKKTILVANFIHITSWDRQVSIPFLQECDVCQQGEVGHPGGFCNERGTEAEPVRFVLRQHSDHGEHVRRVCHHAVASRCNLAVMQRSPLIAETGRSYRL